MKTAKNSQINLENNNYRPYLTSTAICDQLEISRSTINYIRTEMRKHKDRYGEYAVISGGGIALTSYVALIDYLTYRKKLKDKRLASTVPPFDPSNIMKLICIDIPDTDNKEDSEDDE